MGTGSSHHVLLCVGPRSPGWCQHDAGVFLLHVLKSEGQCYAYTRDLACYATRFK